MIAVSKERQEKKKAGWKRQATRARVWVRVRVWIWVRVGVRIRVWVWVWVLGAVAAAVLGKTRIAAAFTYTLQANQASRNIDVMIIASQP